MSTDYDLPEDVDFLLVRRDDELLDALSQRERGYDTLGELADDRALMLLAAFVTDVDAGLDRLLADLDAEVSEPAPALPVVPRQLTRRASVDLLPTSAAPGRTLDRPATGTSRRAHHLGKAGAAAAVAAAVISVSGVAAAVTGNPLAPIQKVADTVSSVFGHGPAQHANDRAKLEAQLHDVDALIRAGRYADAQALLDQLDAQAAGGDEQLKGVQNQLDALEARLTREAAKSAKPVPPGATKAPNSNQPTAQPTQARPSHAPKPTSTRTSGGGTTHVATTPTPPPAPTHPAKPTSTHAPNSGGAAKPTKTG